MFGTVVASDHGSPLIRASNAVRRIGHTEDVSVYFAAQTYETTSFLHLAKSARSLFERFVIARLFLERMPQLDPSRIAREIIPAGLRALLELGDYESCINLCKALDPYVQDNSRAARGMRMNVYLSEAKALRNLGRIEFALARYRDAIKIAQSLMNQLEVSRILLLIGKVYGNYLGQTSLFLAFVEEAQSRLQNTIDSLSSAKERTRARRTLAICMDTLGQAHREHNPVEAAKYFEESRNINSELADNNGAIRAECHLVALAFQQAKSEDEKKTALDAFLDLIDRMRADDAEQRGLGVRWIQYASMLAKLTEEPEKAAQDAAECALHGEIIARRFSDHRTTVRALILRARLLKDQHSEAIELLQNAAQIARSSQLRLLESEIYLDIADRIRKRNVRSIEIRRIIEQNRDLYHHLLRTAIAGVERCGGGNTQEAEFQLLQPKTRQRFYGYLISDLRSILQQLEESAANLTSTVLQAEGRQQELLLIGMSNILARDVLHKVKSLIPLMDANEMREMTNTLTRIASQISQAHKLPQDGRKAIIDDAATALLRASGQLARVGQTLRDLHTTLVNRLARGQVEEQVSLNMCLSEAVTELIRERSLDPNEISLLLRDEVQVRSDLELLKSVLRNLLVNALEGAPGQNIPPGTVQVTLAARHTGDRQLNNPAREISLRIVRVMTSEQDAVASFQSLERGLEGSPSEKVGGTGAGLELAKLVFDYSLGGRLSAHRMDTSVGLEIIMTPGIGTADFIRKTPS